VSSLHVSFVCTRNMPEKSIGNGHLRVPQGTALGAVDAAYRDIGMSLYYHLKSCLPRLYFWADVLDEEGCD
jgi:hypothetical protein